MSPAESPVAQPAALRAGDLAAQTTATRLAVARVLGVDASTLREDTPLASLGWDSLAGVCWGDVVADDGWRADPAEAGRAATIAELARCLQSGGAR